MILSLVLNLAGMFSPEKKVSMKLVLVESPTKARKLTGYLGHEYTVRASVGHIRDLPKSKLGVDVDHDFKPEYLIPKEKAKVVKELKVLASRADQVIIATDPDREGEAIGWHLREVLGNHKELKRFVRATFHEITKPAILAAIDHPGEINLHLVDAQQARRVVDRLVGYTVSPVLWKKIRFGLSAGRVQSVALRLIVEREVEIENFKPEEYWEVDVLLSLVLPQKSPSTLIEKKDGKYFQNNKIETIPEGMIVGRVVEVNGKAYNPKQAADVNPVLAELSSSAYHVQAVEKKARTRVSLPPLTTSTLQQQAATRLGYTSKNTMRLAQALYEEGLITYHRTDSVSLASQAVAMGREYIEQTFGKSYMPDQPRYFATKSKNAQEAHEAIRPTDAFLTSAGLRAQTKGLTEQHFKLYDLIWRRFVACQMQAAVYDQTTILTEFVGKQGRGVVKSTGSILKFDGWMKLFPNQGDVLLPDVKQDQVLHYVEENAAQKFTEPPARYNDASLVKVLESEGIGRPSTYASIISVIEERGYVERREKRFFPTVIGRAVHTFLQEHFDTIVDYKFTANMEDDLDAVARGEKKWQEIVKSFYAPLEKTVEKVVDSAPRAQIPVEKTGVPCPKCGEKDHGEVVLRTGRYGKFKSCSRFPDCDFTENIVEKVPDVKCPLCGEGDVVVKPTRFRRDFFGCGRYPACDWASWSKPKPGDHITPAQWAEQKAERAARKAAREAAMGKAPSGASSSSEKSFAKKSTVMKKNKTSPRATKKSSAKKK